MASTKWRSVRVHDRLWRGLPPDVRRAVTCDGGRYRAEVIGTTAGDTYDKIRRLNTPEAKRAAALWRSTIENH